MDYYKKCIVVMAIFLSIVSCKNSSNKTVIVKDSLAITSEAKLSKPTFSKKLSLNTFTFDIKLNGKVLSIQPSGFSVDNSKIVKEIEGTIINAEIGDLDTDTLPEILIYITSDGSGSYGTVLGFSVTNDKSMSEIFMPNIADNSEANKGYMGHDEFAIVENSFCQRFKTFNPQDTNSKPTGKIRQIQYKLKEGEKSKVFVVDKIIEY